MDGLIPGVQPGGQARAARSPLDQQRMRADRVTYEQHIEAGARTRPADVSHEPPAAASKTYRSDLTHLCETMVARTAVDAPAIKLAKRLLAMLAEVDQIVFAPTPEVAEVFGPSLPHEQGLSAEAILEECNNLYLETLSTVRKKKRVLDLPQEIRSAPLDNRHLHTLARALDDAALSLKADPDHDVRAAGREIAFVSNILRVLAPPRLTKSTNVCALCHRHTVRVLCSEHRQDAKNPASAEQRARFQEALKNEALELQKVASNNRDLLKDLAERDRDGSLSYEDFKMAVAVLFAYRTSLENEKALHELISVWSDFLEKSKKPENSGKGIRAGLAHWYRMPQVDDKLGAAKIERAPDLVPFILLADMSRFLAFISVTKKAGRSAHRSVKTSKSKTGLRNMKVGGKGKNPFLIY